MKQVSWSMLCGSTSCGEALVLTDLEGIFHFYLEVMPRVTVLSCGLVEICCSDR